MQKWLRSQRALPQIIQSKTMIKPGTAGGMKNAQSHILLKSEFMDVDQKLEAVREILQVLEV